MTRKGTGLHINKAQCPKTLYFLTIFVIERGTS